MENSLNNEYRLSYIRGIDGLRALAVISVIIFHLYPTALPGGFTGVDVFFVISGYVVSSSLAKNPRDNYIKFTIDFYARRFIRLMPILLVFLLLMTVITVMIIPQSWLSSTIDKTALASFLGYSNFVLVWYNDGYFSPRVDFNPFAHTWSLSVEEQFYVIFPLIFFLWYRFESSKNKYLSIAVTWILAILFIVSIIYSIYLSATNPDSAFYMLHSRFWELALGGLLFQLHMRNKFVYKAANIHQMLLISGSILVTVGFIFADKTLFPFPWALPATIGTVFLITGFVNNDKSTSLVKYLYENRMMVYVGKISYSLYLWHWAIFVFFRWTVGLDTLLNMAIAITASFLLAAISYKYIEKPFRNSKSIRKWPSWLIVLTGLVVIFASYSFANHIFKNRDNITLSVTKDKHTWYPHTYSTKQDKDFTGKKDYGEHKIFVIGDSHMLAYGTMLQKLSDEYNVKIYRYSSNGCGIADFRVGVDKANTYCKAHSENIYKQIESKAKPGDILFLASLRMQRLCDQWAPFSGEQIYNGLYSEKAIINREKNAEETAKLIKRFSQKELHIIIDAPKPVFRIPPYRCSDWFNTKNPVCKKGFLVDRQYLLQNRKSVMEELEELENKFPRLLVWDPFPILCPTRVCNAFDDNGKPLFFDGDHLSAHGNRVLYPSFSGLIEQIWK